MHYGALMRAGFAVPANFRARVNISAAFQRKLMATINGGQLRNPPRNPFTQTGPSANFVTVGAHDVETVVEKIVELRDAGDADSIDFHHGCAMEERRAHLHDAQRKPKRAGWRNLNPLRPFHSPLTQQDPALENYDELLAGRIVIADLHIGAEAVTKRSASRSRGDFFHARQKCAHRGRNLRTSR